VVRRGCGGSGQGGGGVLGACTCLGLACRWYRVRSWACSSPAVSLVFLDDGDGYELLQVKRRGMVSKSSRRGPRLCREWEGERQ
jgi:hypothetical protein